MSKFRGIPYEEIHETGIPDEDCQELRRQGSLVYHTSFIKTTKSHPKTEIEKEMAHPYRKAYISEAGEILTELEQVVLGLEGGASTPRLANRFFGYVHALHRSSLMFGFDDVAECMRQLETLVNLVFKKKFTFTHKFLDLALATIDEIRLFFQTPEAETEAASERLLEVLGLLKTFIPKLAGEAPAANETPGKPPAVVPQKLGELLVAQGLVPPDKVQSALTEQQHYDKVRQEKARQASETGIRVASTNLDSLVNLIGELVTLQTRFNQLVSTTADQEIAAISSGMDLLTQGMRDTATNIRMMSIGATFNRFRRVVRDLAEEMGKDVEIVISGEDTEMDKTVIEKLDELLPDLVQYCIQADQETPEERQVAGKPSLGSLQIAAARVGTQAVIRLKSDGKGGVGDGRMLFSPNGFGVDLPLVKSALEDMRSTIDVQSQPGQGIEFILTLPVTLAIFDGLLTAVGDRHYVLPLGAIEECVEFFPGQMVADKGGDFIAVRGSLVPYIDLRTLFDIEDTAPGIQQIVIAQSDRRRIGFVVDRVVGQMQTVIKPLGTFLKHAGSFSGATILGDGTVALILNLGKILSKTQWREQHE
jgi:chemotaxis protein histidine kinase CheA